MSDQPQPEEVMPNGPDISHGTTVNAAPQGSNPPAGAAGEECPHCQASLGIHRCRDEASGLEYCSPTCALRGPSTPPPPPPGGTPEVDIRERSDNDELRPSKVVSASFARTLKRQRNEARGQRDDLQAHYDEMKQTCDLLIVHRDEARAALAAALAEVEALRKERTKLGDVLETWFPDITSPHAFPIERAIYLLRLHKLAKGDMDSLRAELEQTRRVRDSLGVGYDEMHDELYSALGMHLTCAAEIDTLRQALTAAEQRADGAEKRAALERHMREEACVNWVEDDTALKALAKKHGIDTEGSGFGVPTMVDCIEEMERALTAQRDTAQRERDGAMKDTARLDWLEGTYNTDVIHVQHQSRWTILPAIGEEIASAPTLRAAIDAALAAKTT